MYIHMLHSVFFSLGNDDVQKRGLEEEIEQDVERRYQDLITRELGKLEEII